MPRRAQPVRLFNAALAGAVEDQYLATRLLLRSCSDSYYEARTRPPALSDQALQRPCTGEISEAYGALVNEALAFLRGESDEVKHRLHALMNEASEAQDYERAASFRDRLTSAISNRIRHQSHTVKDADVFAAHQEAGQTCIQVSFFRSNNWGNGLFPRADKSPPEDVLGPSHSLRRQAAAASSCCHDIPGRRCSPTH